jgi:hypothetical protein
LRADLASNGKAARQGPPARLWIQEFESSLGSQGYWETYGYNWFSGL